MSIRTGISLYKIDGWDPFTLGEDEGRTFDVSVESDLTFHLNNVIENTQFQKGPNPTIVDGQAQPDVAHLQPASPQYFTDHKGDKWEISSTVSHTKADRLGHWADKSDGDGQEYVLNPDRVDDFYMTTTDDRLVVELPPDVIVDGKFEERYGTGSEDSKFSPGANSFLRSSEFYQEGSDGSITNYITNDGRIDGEDVDIMRAQTGYNTSYDSEAKLNPSGYQNQYGNFYKIFYKVKNVDTQEEATFVHFTSPVPDFSTGQGAAFVGEARMSILDDLRDNGAEIASMSFLGPRQNPKKLPEEDFHRENELYSNYNTIFQHNPIGFKIGDPILVPDGYVQGTDANDIIDETYDSDPQGDKIDNGDSQGVLDTALSSDDDVVIGFGGDDTISAGVGNDIIFGDGPSAEYTGENPGGIDGNDYIEGGLGNDTVYGGGGDDSIFGGDGDDIIYGSQGSASDDGGSGTGDSTPVESTRLTNPGNGDTEDIYNTGETVENLTVLTDGTIVAGYEDNPSFRLGLTSPEGGETIFLDTDFNGPYTQIIELPNGNIMAISSDPEGTVDVKSYGKYLEYEKVGGEWTALNGGVSVRMDWGDNLPNPDLSAGNEAINAFTVDDKLYVLTKTLQTTVANKVLAVIEYERDGVDGPFVATQNVTYIQPTNIQGGTGIENAISAFSGNNLAIVYNGTGGSEALTYKLFDDDGDLITKSFQNPLPPTISSTIPGGVSTTSGGDYNGKDAEPYIDTNTELTFSPNGDFYYFTGAETYNDANAMPVAEVFIYGFSANGDQSFVTKLDELVDKTKSHVGKTRIAELEGSDKIVAGWFKSEEHDVEINNNEGDLKFQIIDVSDPNNPVQGEVITVNHPASIDGKPTFATNDFQVESTSDGGFVVTYDGWILESGDSFGNDYHKEVFVARFDADGNQVDIDYSPLTDNDNIEGGLGDDTIYGGDGDDTITGGSGDDTITGGSGDDTFIYTDDDGADIITDFNFGNTGTIDDGDNTNNDHVDLSAFYNSDTLDAVIAAGGNVSNALGMLRKDAADGKLDGVIDGTDYSSQIGNIDLTLQGVSGESVKGNELTVENTNVVCFCQGTMIKTIDGDKAVEYLEAGDLVLTVDCGYQPLQLALSRKVDAQTLAANPKLRPVTITAGAMGPGVPERDLRVSRQHRIVVSSEISSRMFRTSEVLVAAFKLTELPGIYVDENTTSVEYFHLVFDSHQIVLANGTPSESFFPGEEGIKALTSKAREEFRALFPDEALTQILMYPARHIPSGNLQKKLVDRHRRNAKILLEEARS